MKEKIDKLQQELNSIYESLGMFMYKNEMTFSSYHIAKALGERLARTMEAAFIGGTGTGQPLGVLIPDKLWASFIEDLEALSSKRYLENIKKARVSRKRYSSKQVKKILDI